MQNFELYNSIDKVIYKSQIHKVYKDIDFYINLEIKSFICVIGSKWRKKRKILTPTFHFAILKQFVDIFIEEGHRMTTFLKDVNNSNINDLANFISQHTLNAICGK